MSDDKKPGQAGDQDAAEATSTAATSPPTEDSDKVKADGGSETEGSAKQNAADPRNARKLSMRNRARDDAVAALLGGSRGPGGNVFIVDSIGYVDAAVGGSHPAVDVTRYGTVPSGPIPKPTLRGIVKTFVQPGNYPEIRRQLKARSVLLLRAPTGWGRTAAALVLLDAACNEGVDKLNPDTSLRAPGELGLQPNHG